MTLAGSAGDPREAPDARGPGSASEADALSLVLRLRALGGLLEFVLWLAVAGSALAFGAVHPRAYETLWIVCGLAGLLAFARAAVAARARRHLGARTVALHSSGRSLVIDPPRQDGTVVWKIDLGSPPLPRPPLLWPGAALVALILLQLVAWPPAGERVTLSPEATGRGLAFVIALLALHQAAAVAFTDEGARRRFRQVVAWLGFLLGLVALFQLASGLDRIYGLFRPWESPSFFGPFVNRNHFAGYMLLVIPVGLGVLAEARRRYRRRLGERPGLRRRLVTFGSTEGTRLVYAALPPLVAIAALLASTSRGGLLAFAGSMSLAAIGLRRRRGTPVWAAALVFVVLALSWFGMERLEARFVRVGEDSPGRTVVWSESLAVMSGSRWVTGYGFNTFAEALSRVPAWALPRGATPWPEAVRAELLSGGRFGYRAPGDLPGLGWYREAHNDWLQILVEAGVPGLGIALGAALVVLLAARGDPWLLAALAGPLLHALVDFDFQIPAIPVLFACLAALAGARVVARRP